MKCDKHDVTDMRYPHVDELPIPACREGVEYGVWEGVEGGGFSYISVCALSAANWAAGQLDECPQQGITIRIV